MVQREAVDQAVARGSEQLKAGKLEEAQRHFRTALDLDPDNARVLALLGLAYFRGGDLGAAQPIYEQLVERAPIDASHRLNLGLVYLKVGDSDRAISSLEASRALDPSQGRAVNYLGLAYARAGRYAEAYRAFLIAGQQELAREIEINLTQGERDGIHQQLGRTPDGPLPEPTASIATPTDPLVPLEPRTKPPSAPPKSRSSQELPAVDPIDASVEASFGALENGPEYAVGDGSSPEIAILSEEDDRARVSDSMQFVIPKRLLEESAPRDAVEEPEETGHAISRAVKLATPVAAAAVARPSTRAGGTPAQPLSELATEELVRPDEADDAFEIGANGALVIRVTERVIARLTGVHVTGGDLAYELATRRSRGHQTEEPFGTGAAQMHAITGTGYLIAVPGDAAFTAVVLDDDILYLREDLVFAFEATLRWENGNVPGLRGKLPVVQFRGDGSLALRLARPLVRVKLAPQGVVYVDAERLAGWIGRVIPRAVVPPSGGPMGAMCVECTGEGVVLVEPAPPPAARPRDDDDDDEPAIIIAPPPPPPAPRAPEPEPSDPDEAIDRLDDNI